MSNTDETAPATGRGRRRAHAGEAARRTASLPDVLASQGPKTRGAKPPADDRSRLGAANRRRGAEAERKVAGWLRAHGFPGAERAVRTGFTSGGRTVADPGDITGTPALVWQVKDQAREAIDVWLAETEQQRLGGPGTVPADLGLLVVRRRGKPDPGRWWVWLPLEQLVALVVDVDRQLVPHRSASGLAGVLVSDLDVDGRHRLDGSRIPRPVRLELADLVPLLRASGYGELLAQGSAEAAPSPRTQLQKQPFVGEAR